MKNSDLGVVEGSTQCPRSPNAVRHSCTIISLRVSQPFMRCGPLTSTYMFRGPLGTGLEHYGDPLHGMGLQLLLQCSLIDGSFPCQAWCKNSPKLTIYSKKSS